MFVLVMMQENPHHVIDISTCVDQLRMNPDAYEAMWLVFGPTVNGTNKWKGNVTSIPMSSMLTVSDEAFLLVVLDNYIERWDAMIARSNAGYTMVSHHVSF